MHTESPHGEFDLHEHPEILFETTPRICTVAEKLRPLACAKSSKASGVRGVVGRDSKGKLYRVGQGHRDCAQIWTRLPIHEQTGLDYLPPRDAPTRCHACGPRTATRAMLLGRAQYLAETRQLDADGRWYLSGPPKKVAAARREMCEDGMMDRLGHPRSSMACTTARYSRSRFSSGHSPPAPVFAAPDSALSRGRSRRATLPSRMRTIVQAL